MPETLSLPDLDALDPAALKALLLAHHERYTARLSSSASEIERLVMLVEKLQRMLFGAKSEKVLRQIEHLELQLEELQAASAIEEIKDAAKAERSVPAKPLRRPLPEHLPREESIPTCPITTAAPTAAASCASWVRMWPRCSDAYGPASR